MDSFLCSFRFGLAVLCFFVVVNLYAQRIGMSIAIVCMVNHTAVKLMRDAAQPSSSSSSSGGGNLTTATPGDWQRNESNDAVQRLRSHCDSGSELVAGSNLSRTVVIICPCQREGR